MTNPTTNISEDFKFGYEEGKKQKEAEILEMIDKWIKKWKLAETTCIRELKSKIKGEKGK
jgi:hypothetical protein